MSDHVIRYSDFAPEDLYHKTLQWFNENFNGEGNIILDSEKGKFIRIQNFLFACQQEHVNWLVADEPRFL